MALATKHDDDEKTMATDVIAPGTDDSGGGGGSGGGRPQERPHKAEAGGGGGGFFTIYKKGQGYWTRLCTAFGAALFIIFLVAFIFQQLPPWIRPAFMTEHATGVQQAAADRTAKNVTAGICAAVGLGSVLLSWYLMNKADNADFLIATDSEMKKVNWTSKKELIGSTKVVIFFMLVIAAVLFLIDVLFGYVFYWFGVLWNKPF